MVGPSSLSSCGVLVVGLSHSRFTISARIVVSWFCFCTFWGMLLDYGQVMISFSWSWSNGSGDHSFGRGFHQHTGIWCHGLIVSASLAGCNDHHWWHRVHVGFSSSIVSAIATWKTLIDIANVQSLFYYDLHFYKGVPFKKFVTVIPQWQLLYSNQIWYL